MPAPAKNNKSGMSTTARRWVLLGIIALAAITTFISWPDAYNQPVGWINRTLHIQLPTNWQPGFAFGLDLQGGTHLVYSADVTQVPDGQYAEAVAGVRDVIERRVNAFGVSEPVVQTNKVGDDWRVIVELAGVKDVTQAIDLIGKTPLLEFKEQDPDPKVSAEQQAQIDQANASALEQAKNIVREIEQGSDFATIAKERSQDPGSRDNGGDLGFTARGQFVAEFDKALFDDLKVGEMTKEPVKTEFGYHIIRKAEERTTESGQYEVRGSHILIPTITIDQVIAASGGSWVNTGLSGKHLKRSEVTRSPQSGLPQISLTFNNEGSELFRQITEKNVGKQIAIFLDGQLLQAPVVNESIAGGNAVITGSFTLTEAKQHVRDLNAGALPVPITLVSQQTVGATLGNASVAKSFTAAIIGFVLVAIFMIVLYRLPGLLSVIALLIYIGISLSLFKMVPVTLTLAGIAGFILSIGMAVDANILIFERLKEELRAGRSLSVAMEDAFRRAWLSIRDSNASSLITCAILFYLGSSLIKGFALTLALGIIISMFTAIVTTRVLLRSAGAWRWLQHPWLYGVRIPKSE